MAAAATAAAVVAIVAAVAVVAAAAAAAAVAVVAAVAVFYIGPRGVWPKSPSQIECYIRRCLSQGGAWFNHE